MTTPFVAAADWGTSRFRLWLLAADGTVLAERRSEEGLAQSAAAGFAAVLETHLSALAAPPDLPVMVCGMAGSRQGWREAAYLPIPARLDAVPGAAIRIPDLPRDVRILPGLSRSAPPDVMRGEETQLLGAAPPDGLACLPGTHSKWVAISGGRVEAFSTFMTGELYDLLARQSILRHSIGPGHDEAAFDSGLIDATSDPASVTNRLFGLRAAGLVGTADPAATASRLSGLLIGLELAGALRLYWQPASVVLIASGPLAGLYRFALDKLGIAADLRDADAAARAGLLAAAHLLRG